MGFLSSIGNQVKLGMSTIKDLNPTLLAKLDKNSVIGTLSSATASNSPTAPVSTAALTELNSKTDLNTQRIDAMIQDTSTAGTTATWSIDQIKAYIAEVDDTYFAADLAERDDDAIGLVIPKRQGVRVFVANASSDPEVGYDTDGTPFGAHYIYNGTDWVLIRTLQYRQTDVSELVRYSDVVDSLTSIAVDKPLSANQGRLLSESIAAGISGLVMAVDDTTVLAGGVIELTKVAKGEAANGMAFVVMAEGIIPVFVAMASDGASATIITDDPSVYVGTDVRISYITSGVATGNTGAGGDGGDGMVI